MRFRIILVVSALLISACAQTSGATEGEGDTPVATTTATAEPLETTTTQFAAAVTFQDASTTSAAGATTTAAPETTTTTAPETTTTAAAAPVTTTTHAAPATTAAPQGCPNIAVGQDDVTESQVWYDGDGDGVSDILMTYRDNEANWNLQVHFSSGGGAQVALAVAAQDWVEPLGGFDINGDGKDEAFVRTGGGASSTTVSLFSTWTDCVLEPIVFAATGNFYTVTMGFSIGSPSGAFCDGFGSIIEYSGSLLDNGNYLLNTTSYFLSENELIYGPVFDPSEVPPENMQVVSNLDCGNITI